MVFQSYALYPHMTVRQNLGYGLKVRKTPKAEAARRVDEVAKVLRLEELLDRRPAQLSGGQRQRVAMGRAVVREPAAFLMDEPLSNLDAKLRVSMRAELASLHARLGATTVYVTHDQVEAMTLGQRVAVMRDGRIQQVDAPQALYHRPKNLFVAAFIGSPAMNLVEARVEDGRVAFGGHRIPIDVPVPEGEVILGIRPESFEDAAFADPSLPQLERVFAAGPPSPVRAAARGDEHRGAVLCRVATSRARYARGEERQPDALGEATSDAVSSSTSRPAPRPRERQEHERAPQGPRAGSVSAASTRRARMSTVVSTT